MKHKAMHKDLGLRAAASKHWKWRAGMLVRGGCMGEPDAWRRLVEYDEGQNAEEQVTRWFSDPWPDLADPATVGCLIAIVRRAWKDPAAYVAPADGWFVSSGLRQMLTEGQTEAEALVAALEAAP